MLENIIEGEIVLPKKIIFKVISQVFQQITILCAHMNNNIYWFISVLILIKPYIHMREASLFKDHCSDNHDSDHAADKFG